MIGRGCALFVLLCVVGACSRSENSIRQQSVAAASASPDPGAELSRLDHRSPLPLLPMMANHQKQNMRDHLRAVAEITSAVSVGDFPAVTRAVSRIGTSASMTQMCEHMGSHAQGFTELALDFHRSADAISTAAERQDRDAVLAALGHTLGKCTGCHETYKQELVDQATWRVLSE